MAATEAGNNAGPAAVKVLHVLGSLERGGVETWLLDLLPRLDRSRWQFDFCTVGPACGRYASLARSRGSRVAPCPRGSGKGLAGSWSFARRLSRILRDGNYLVVHSHVHWFSAVVLAVARAAGVPVRVGHSHNTQDGVADAWRRVLYRSAARRLLGASCNLGLACSTDTAAALFGRTWAQNSRVRVVPYGLNGRLQMPEPAPGLRGRLRIAADAPVLGHVGRFDRQKNHDFLLQIAAAVKARNPQVRWLLVGDGERRAEMEEQARRLDLAAAMIFAGQREDVPELMSSAMDAFVFPSLHEGLPLALLEAQAAGLRSLVSAGITREAAVLEGAVDFLPLEAGPEAWAERALALLERGRLPRDQARQALEGSRFTIGRSLEALLEAYRSVLIAHSV